jgi:uncharacterized protein (TIGR04255 family)
MKENYPNLKNTPVKEIVLDLQFFEDLNFDFYNVFDSESSILFENFDNCVPLMGSKFSLTELETKRKNEQLGLVFKSNSEVLFLRRESFTYHYIKGYLPYEKLQHRFFELLEIFSSTLDTGLKVSNLSMRYVNEIFIDPIEIASNLIFTYPKQSPDRTISNYQYVTEFTYKEHKDFLVRIISSKVEDSKLLLDITVSKDEIGALIGAECQLEKSLKIMRELKNRVFFDSVTVQTLIKYL